jgi:hypothetical protein
MAENVKCTLCFVDSHILRPLQFSKKLGVSHPLFISTSDGALFRIFNSQRGKIPFDPVSFCLKSMSKEWFSDSYRRLKY